MEYEIRNAVIEKTRIGFMRGTFLSINLYLDYGNSCQIFGGDYVWGNNNLKEFRSLKILNDIMKLIGVDCWEDLVGQHVRVKANHNEIIAIGNILEGKWLCVKDYFKKEK